MVKHSEHFIQIISRNDPYTAIRSITHSQPLLVFWVTPEGIVLDAHDAHHDNPPESDRSILAHRTHKGHLRGRAAFIGSHIYIVIYGDAPDSRWSNKQCKHITQAVPALRKALTAQGVPSDEVDRAVIIDECGRGMV